MNNLGNPTYRNGRIGLLFLSPWLIGFVAFVVYPFVTSLWWSFCDYDLLTTPRFAGAVHYRRLATEFASGTGFGRALWNTAYYACLAVPLSIALAIALAVILSWQVRGRRLYGALCFLPSVVPVVAMTILWMWLLDPADGLVNHVLRSCGVSNSALPNWLADYREAAWLPAWFTGDGGLGSKDALVLMAMWGVGNFMVIYMAALLDVPDSLHEAAMLDGASRTRRFFGITLPLLTPVILFNLVTGLIRSVQALTQMYIVSEGTGAPQESTLVLSLHLFLSAFQDLNMGYASAMAWIVFVVLVLATWLLMRSSKSWVHYPGNAG